MDGFLQYLWQFLWLGKWFIAFFILWPLFESTWLFWRQELYKHSREFRMMLQELRIPREIKKSPRAMEQVLLALHALANAPGDLREKWWDGEVTRWFSLEMVSFSGEIRFFIRHPYKQRPLVEAAFYSYYPDVELGEVDDYLDAVPKDMNEVYGTSYDLWGGEMKLVREPAYPIRSYLSFESPDEDKQYDPISVFLEVLGKAKKGEFVGIQILIAPNKANDWHEEWKDLVEKLKQPKKGEKPDLHTAAEYPGGPLPALSVKKPEEETQSWITLTRTPGETDVLKAVEANLAKPAYETIIRFMYLSPQPLFYDSYARRGLTGAFNQYSALDLNSFSQNYAISTRTRFWNWPHIFPKIRNEYRKASLLWHYRHREMPHETFMGKLLTSDLLRWNFSSKTMTLNTESLATLYHPPTFVVLTAPHVKRVESRKAGPPAGLAIYGDEKEIEQYQ